MSDRRRGFTGRLSQVVRQCFGMGPLSDRQAAELMQQADPKGYLVGLCDEGLLPHDTILVLDVSGSMSRKDCVPSRLEASRKAAEAFTRRRAALSLGDRVAIVAFNNHGRVVLPLTEVLRLDEIMQRLSSLKTAGGTDMAEGLKTANSLFAQDVARHPTLARYRRILLLTDGRGGKPLPWAIHLKSAGVLIEVIGVGGNTSEVDERLLRQVASTDVTGLVHYWFFNNTENLVAHYEDLASGLVFRGHNR